MNAHPNPQKFFSELPVDPDLKGQPVETLLAEETEIKARAERVRRLIRTNRAFTPARSQPAPKGKKKNC
jgi:hypothetical protein